MFVYPTTLHYRAQLGLYTITGRWNAFSGECGRGVTTGGAAVSCRTTSSCRRRSRRCCAGDSNRCASAGGVVMLAGDAEVIAACWSWVRGEGLVGGVKNTSSSEVSPTGPTASGHLQSHFHTAARTRITSKRGMVRERRQLEENTAKRCKWVQVSK